MSDLQSQNILIYQADDNRIRLEVKLEEKNIWLSQKQLGELYQKSKATISEHIKHIFEEGELNTDSVVRNFRTTAQTKNPDAHGRLDKEAGWVFRAE